MPGISTIIGGIRHSVAQLRSEHNAKIGDLQSQIDALSERLDKYDKPVASSKSKSKTPAAKKTSGKKRPVPIPEKPEVMKAAEETAEE